MNLIKILKCERMSYAIDSEKSIIINGSLYNNDIYIKNKYMLIYETMHLSTKLCLNKQNHQTKNIAIQFCFTDACFNYIIQRYE